MKSQTMSRVLLTVFILLLLVGALFFAGEGMRAMAWLWLIVTVVLLALVWVPWQKLRQPK